MSKQQRIALPEDTQPVTSRRRRRGSMVVRMAVMLILAAVVLGGIFGFQAFKATMIKKVMASLANPPQTISTVIAQPEEWQTEVSAVGNMRAVAGADLSLQLPGIVSEIDFKSGDDVQEGQVLLRLRSDDEVAKLHALQATAQLAQITLDRDLKLFHSQVRSQSTLDTDTANLKSALAQVTAQQAVIDQKILRAPFAGHLGIRAVDLGQYLPAGTMTVTLQALNPIYADFYLPQQALAHIKVGQAVTAKVDTYPHKRFAGTIEAINPQVDTGSRNVQIRATLANPDHTLLPGMFATLSIETGAPRQEITLPQTAITYNPYGNTVFLVVPGGKDAHGKPLLVAEQRFVTTGETRGDQVAVLKGVKAGDVVVSSGQIKLRNGVPVVVNNDVQPANNPNPALTDP